MPAPRRFRPVSGLLSRLLPGRWGALARAFRDRGTHGASDMIDEALVASLALMPISKLRNILESLDDPRAITSLIAEMEHQPRAFGESLVPRLLEAWSRVPVATRWKQWSPTSLWQVTPTLWPVLQPLPATTFGGERWDGLVLVTGQGSVSLLSSSVWMTDTTRPVRERWEDEMDRLWGHRPARAWSHALDSTAHPVYTNQESDLATRANTLAGLMPVWEWLRSRGHAQVVVDDLPTCFERFAFLSMGRPDVPALPHVSAQGCLAAVVWKRELPFLQALHDQHVLAQTVPLATEGMGPPDEAQPVMSAPRRRVRL